MATAIYLGLLAHKSINDDELSGFIVGALWCVSFDILLLVALWRLH